MGTDAFLVTTGAVLIANLLTVVFVYCMWNIFRLDRQYGDGHNYKAQPAHIPYLLGICAVCAVALLGLATAVNPRTPSAASPDRLLPETSQRSTAYSSPS